MHNAPDKKDARQYRFDYMRVNLRTGRMSHDSQYFMNARGALHTLDRWNCQQPDEWLYIPCKEDEAARTVAYALKAASTLIYGRVKDGADHLQLTIDLARIGLGLDALPPQADAPGKCNAP